MTASSAARPLHVLVTGGGGFIGGGIARALAAAGHSVRSFSRGEHPGLAERGIEPIRGDVADAAAVLVAAEGCDIVFHAAARAGVWGKRRDYERSNVLGTENVIAACRALRIPRLVFTSSPSVTFDGRDQEGVDESAPYAERFLADYPRTKAAAERLVRAAASESLATVSLRPHLVWGPGDPHFFPRLVERARSKRLALIGSRECRVDSTFIDNAVEAHLAAAQRLAPGSPISGKAYFISNGEPLPLGILLGKLLFAAGLPPIRKRVPVKLAYGLAAIGEGIHRTIRRRSEPKLTRFTVRQFSTAHWFDIGAARRELGWTPRVSIDEGIVMLKASLAERPRTAAPARG